MRIECCDSMCNEGVEILQSTMSYLKDEHLRLFNSSLPRINTWTLKSWGASIPQQSNAFDCGVFVCIFAETLVRGSLPKKIDSIRNNPRNRILNAVLDKEINLEPDSELSIIA